MYANREIDSTGTFPTMATIWLSATAVSCTQKHDKADGQATDLCISFIIVYELWSTNVGPTIQTHGVR